MSVKADKSEVPFWAVQFRCRMASPRLRNPWSHWRTTIAWWLRGRADQLDGYQSIALLATTTPGVDRKVGRACLRRGLVLAQSLLCEEARLKAVEIQMRNTLPQLYDPKTDRQN